MKGILNNIWNWIKRVVRQWNELLLLPVAFLLWIYAETFLRWIDPAAGTLDIGLLHDHVYAMIGTMICHFTAWLLLKLTFPNIHLYFYRRFEFDLLDESKDLISKTLLSEKKWARLKYSFWLFALYLVTYLVVLATV